SSYRTVYTAYGPSEQWNVFSRNITLDYLDSPLTPSTISSTIQVRYLYFYIYANGGTDQYIRSFVDDVNLVNETNSYVWIGGTTRNGNWESSGSWSNAGNLDESLVSQSAMAHSGSWSANLTTTSYGNWSYCELDSQPNARITALNPGILSFWWYLSYQHATTYSKSVLWFYLYNGAQYFDLVYFMGYGGVSAPFSNTSSRLCINVNGFNTTDSWVYCERDIWADAGAFFSTNELFVDYCYFWMENIGIGTQIITLLDDVRLESGAVNGAGYEDQGVVGSRVRGWGWDYEEYDEFRVTDTAYSGSKAANFTLNNGAGSDFDQELNWRPLNGSRETYLDVMWRLDDYTPTSGNYARIRVYFENGYNLFYYLASYSGLLPSNSSSSGFFNVTGASTMYTWMQMHRDLVHDYEAVFGSKPDTTILRIYLYGSTTAGNRLELLLDDFYLYDDPAPQVSNVQRSPLAPDHNEAVQISADIAEQDLDTALLYYRINSGTWQNTTMTYQSGNTYTATISGQPHGTFVEYYMIANDTWGMTTTALDAGGYWGYTAWDHTPPSISSIEHSPDPVEYFDIVTVSADVTDGVTGLASVVLYYKVGGGPFIPVSMTPTTGDQYEAQIPAQNWNALVQYYINATDNVDNFRVMNNGGLFYSYTVGDTTDPVVSIDSPTDGAEVSGVTVISATANDPGSGIWRVEYYVNSTYVGQDFSAPYNFSLDTTLFSAGVYVITALAYDNVGNTGSDSVTVTINNVPETTTTTPPIPGFPIEAIGLALVASISIGVIHRRHRKL
ncbi:MAG: Ig-like domain-containing protein, partial [Promethearchaeota archaeon]